MSTFSPSRLLKSFSFAFAGGATLLKTQANFRLEGIATAVVIAAGIYLRVSRIDWLLLCIAIGFVWMSEAFNTALEFLADEVTTEISDRIEKAKDVAAFSVLVAAIVAAAIGSFVFIPHLISLK